MTGDPYNPNQQPWTPNGNSQPGQAGQPSWSQFPEQNNAPTEFYNDATMAGPIMGNPAMPNSGMPGTPTPPPYTNMGQAPYAPQSSQPAYPYTSRARSAAYKAKAGAGGSFWPKDPAYRVLYIAIGIILLCSIVGVVMLVSAFSHGSQGPDQSNNGTIAGQTSGTPTPASTAQQQPTPTPTSTPIPTPTPSPTPQPTPSPTAVVNNGPLTVQITNLPGTVDNHSTVPITVTTNKPGSTVKLVIFYIGGQPVTQQLGPQAVDANGNTTLYWNINESGFKFFGSMQITAHITAYAQDQNNNTATSPAATVQIRSR